MKKVFIFLMIISVLLMLFCGCADNQQPNVNGGNSGNGASGTETNGDETSFGEELNNTDAYDGYFSETVNEVTVEYISGTAACYTIEGNTLTFGTISEDTIYSVSGKLNGNIVIDVGEDYKFELELHGLSLVSESATPITVLSGDKVSIKATKDYENYIYDKRPAVTDDDETTFKGAIHSEVDLEISGKGSLTIISENNNGIHTKDDLEVKNLTLFVACTDNALKGNDNVEISGGNLTLIASQGDGIKTSNSDISSKGNQRGTVTFNGGTHTIYAACDGIDAAYDVLIEVDTVLNIYTDKYSNYSKEIIDVSESLYFIRYTSNIYNYSVKYYNSDTDFEWVNATYHSVVSGGRTNYYYYSLPRKTQYAKMQFFIYASGTAQGQSEEYLAASDYITPNDSYDTFALTNRGGSLSYSWTNYTTAINDGGFGGMGGGNTDKAEYSSKGIKAANQVIINGGSIEIKSYDDAIHANNDVTLENGVAALGNITISGGILTLYSNDDAVHADGLLSVVAGTINITHSYEGLEANIINISGGDISVIASDDGINGVSTTQTAITISDGSLYIYCNGDGIDSNSRVSYGGIAFLGGRVVIVSTSNGNSAIDSEQGYKYSGGTVVAVMSRGAMTSEATHCQNFSSIGKVFSLSLTENAYLRAKVGSEGVTVKMPCSLSAYIVTLGSSTASVVSESSTTKTLNGNGVCWDGLISL